MVTHCLNRYDPLHPSRPLLTGILLKRICTEAPHTLKRRICEAQILITPYYLGGQALFAVVRHRMMRSTMLSEWVTSDFSTMCSAWHIRVDVFVVFMNSLSHQRKKCTLRPR